MRHPAIVDGKLSVDLEILAQSLAKLPPVAIALEKGAQALERGEPPAAVADYLRFLAKEVQSVVDVV